MPEGSLARHLILRLLPPVLLLVAIDLVITWYVTTQIHLEVWLLRDIFWAMLLGQFLLVVLFAWVLISGVRSSLHSINRLADDLKQRSLDDLQPLDATGLTTEIAPVVARVNELLSRLDQSVQAQKRFIGHAAHQFRTPLSGLKLECELMLANELPDDVRARAERIKTVTDRLIRLGQQLLVLARADASARPQDTFQRLDLADWVRVNGAEWVPRAHRQHVSLQLAAPDEPVWIDADPLLLSELLGNLIDNALCYGGSVRHIRLQVNATPPALLVEDDGDGIDPADQDRVFEAFYRSPQSQGTGSGLGLAIVREIASAHGAWWSLTSRPRLNGTRVSIVFPGPRIGANLTRQ
ncbi:MAG TPA: HAMP domain-containing sensor histidine kinase [Pusillimonas sp.]|uniref:sensor histidine kinase n=1 Tax=Pusillimonas sp. TaxID=3040095 RepID=UPI002CD18174|nr:HAMP domain-containing sensor histidine kinase [Pusillimonas sp.]HUH87077.1 HAMP domain-containing sensor histidine kinase [Pusillimonas sp.]